MHLLGIGAHADKDCKTLHLTLHTFPEYGDSVFHFVRLRLLVFSIILGSQEAWIINTEKLELSSATALKFMILSIHDSKYQNAINRLTFLDLPNYASS